MNLLARAIPALAAIALLGVVSHAATAQVFISTDTTINTTIANNVVVGYASGADLSGGINGTSPTVDLVPGGNIGLGLTFFNASIGHLSGGLLTRALGLANFSTVYLTGSTLNRNINIGNSARLEMTGGSVNQNVTIFGQGVFNYRGGQLNTGSLVSTIAQVRNQGTFNIFGSNITFTVQNPDLFGNTRYSLTGTLLDGTDLTGKLVDVQNGTGASIAINPTQVPEPGNAALVIGLTGAGLIMLRNRRK